MHSKCYSITVLYISGFIESTSNKCGYVAYRSRSPRIYICYRIIYQFRQVLLEPSHPCVS
jgi:hypothetical protein